MMNQKKLMNQKVCNISIDYETSEHSSIDLEDYLKKRD